MAWVALERPAPGIDDAYITLVYGRNLANGHGFVYTPGGEHVEGATSLAWTFVVAMVALFTNHPEYPLIVVSLLLTSLGLVFAWRALCTLVVGSSPRQELSVAAILFGFMLFQPGFWVWNVLSLMENALWGSIVAFAVAELAEGVQAIDPLPGQRSRLAAVAVLGALTRPEWLVLFPALLLAAFLLVQKSSSLREALRRYLLPLAVFGLAIAGVMLARLWYFGFPFPNTYYVKSGQDFTYQALAGTQYLAQFLVNRPWNGALLLLLLGMVVSRLGRALRGELTKPEVSLFLLAAAVLVGLVLPVPNGGDAFADFRFYQPFIPLMVAPAVLWGLAPGRWEWLLRRRLLIGAGALMTAGMVAAIWGLFYRKRQMLGGEFRAAEIGRRIGDDLSRVFPEVAPSVGVVAAGGIAWSYRGPVVDLLGLNWTAMAHSKADRRGMRHGHGAFSSDVFWSSPPDLLVLDLHLELPAGPACDEATTEALLATPVIDEYLRGLTGTQRFTDEYEPACLGVGARSVAAYVSRRSPRAPSQGYRALRRD